MSDTVLTNPVTDNPLPCFVRHENAGGQCGRWATMEVYGLHFCEAHGEDVRLGVESQEAHEAWMFFERFRQPHVESLGGRIDAEIEAALKRITDNRPSGDDEANALLRAYPVATERVKQHVTSDEEDEPGYPTFYDSCQDSIYTLHRVMRIAGQDGATWLVEMLEMEREEVSALAAEALRRQQQRRAVE